MRLSTKDPDATPWWARRRTLGVFLALSALVASGATAQASSHGDGFFSSGAAHRTTTTTLGTGGTTGHLTTGGTTGTTTARDTWSWTGSGYTWNGNEWAWTGSGVNRFAYSAVSQRTNRTFNELLGINDRGLIVGFTGSGKDARHPNRGFRLTTVHPRFATAQFAFRAENFPRSLQTQAVGVNNAGVSVGFFVDAKGANHGYVRSHGGRFRVVDFPGTTSRPAVNQLLGINNAGIAVGFFNDRAGRSHSYLFNTRTHHFTLLRVPVHTTSLIATGINDRGQIVGFFRAGKHIRSFILTTRHGRHRVTVLNFGNHTNTMALGINNFGVVVGSFADRHKVTRGFVRVNAHLVRVLTAPGATSTVVNGVNNRGQIVGFLTDARHHRTLGFLAHR